MIAKDYLQEKLRKVKREIGSMQASLENEPHDLTNRPQKLQILRESITYIEHNLKIIKGQLEKETA